MHREENSVFRNKYTQPEISRFNHLSSIHPPNTVATGDSEEPAAATTQQHNGTNHGNNSGIDAVIVDSATTPMAARSRCPSSAASAPKPAPPPLHLMKKPQFDWHQYIVKRVYILSWIRSYDQNAVIGDAIAGVTLGLTMIPQAIAYAALAGLPSQYGLYSAFVGECGDTTRG